MSVPYFGTSDWVTMYDFPKHETAAAHLPIRVIWSISQLANSIPRNNAKVDRALAALNELASPAAAEQYLKHPADLSDTETRAKVIAQTFKELEESLSLSEILKKNRRSTTRRSRSWMPCGLCRRFPNRIGRRP